MSILYCSIPGFITNLARQKDDDLEGQPLVVLDPEGRVWGVSAEAAACGVAAGMAARTAGLRCPEARLLEGDVGRCREAFEALLQVLERASLQVEPHGWGAAYVDLGKESHDGAVALGKDLGAAIRCELGAALQPALGWDSSKFTAQAAARRTRPGRLLAVEAAREPAFLRPLPVSWLPLPGESLLRLGFLGLRTLGQYAALPPAAVWQQFGRAGKLAQQVARGRDPRPVVPRWQTPALAASCEFDWPLVAREQLLAALERLVAPLAAEMGDNLQACGRARLGLRFEDGGLQEATHSFLSPTADIAHLLRVLGGLADGLRWPGPAVGLEVTLEQIQDAVPEQLPLFSLEDPRAEKLRQVERYLAARFGAARLRRAVLSHPTAPLPEWRAGWLAEDEA
jgi:nucleotidyltransferase/DNA polymerase involved in DNA repair